MRKLSRKQKNRNNHRAKASAKRAQGSRKLKKGQRQEETQRYQALARTHGSRRDRGWDQTPGDDPAALRRSIQRQIEREERASLRAAALKG